MKRRAPYLTIALILINAAVFFALDFTGGVDLDRIYRFGGLYYYSVVKGGEWWRLITSCFLHFDIMHLGYNMISLLATGSNIELRYGKAVFCLTYLISGIVSGIGSMLIHHNAGEDFLSAGASGAICGLIGFCIIRIIKEGGFTLANLARPLIAIILIVYSGATDGSVDQLAHVCGLICGALICLFYRPKREIPSE